MNKWVRIGFPILCVAVVGGTLIAIGNMKKQADKIAEQRNTVNFGNMTVSNNSTNYTDGYNNTMYGWGEKETNTVNEVNNNTNIDNLDTNTSNTDNSNTTVSNTSTNSEKNTSVSTNNTTTNNKSEETTEDLAGTDEKEKAITLVAKEWGEDSSVYYTNEGISSGLYIVAVRDKSNTSVKMFYKVDVKNNTVEVDW